MSPIPKSDAHCAWILVRNRGEPLLIALAEIPNREISADELLDYVRAEAIDPALDVPEAARLEVTSSAASVTPSPHVSSRQALLQSAPHITAVVCTLGKSPRLNECLESLVAQAYPDFSVLVVDNSPNDPGVRRLLSALNTRGIRVEYLAESRAGLSWARNRAVVSVGSGWLAWIDDDEVADPHWLAELYRGAAEHQGVAAVAGVMLPLALETRAQVLFEQYGGHAKHRGLVPIVFSKRGPQNPIHPLPPFGTGGNMLVSVGALKEAGGFDTSLGAGTLSCAGEDTRMFTELLERGHSVVYQPTAITLHYHRRTMRELRKQLRGYGAGVGAYYAAILLGRPSRLWSLLRLIPELARDTFFGSARRTAQLPADFPASILWANRLGLVSGPLRYVAARVVAGWRRASNEGDSSG